MCAEDHGKLLDQLRGGIGIAAMANVTNGHFCGTYGKGTAMVQIGGYGTERYKDDPATLEEFLREEVKSAKRSGATVAVNFLGGDSQALLQFAEAFARAGGDYLEFNAHTSTPHRLAMGLGYAHLKLEKQQSLYRVTRRLAESSSVPLLIKGRVWTPGESATRVAPDFGQIALELQRAGAIGLHLNIRNEARRDPDLEVVKEIRARSDMFLLASGYVGLTPAGKVDLDKAVADVAAFLEAGVDLVMIGQAALDSPEIISSLAARLAEKP